MFNGSSKGNAQTVIEGIVTGAITPVFDGLTGYAAGKGRVTKIRGKKAEAKISLYLEDSSKANIDLFEALKLTEDVPWGKVKSVEPRRPDGVTYRQRTVPKEGWAADGTQVYRGDKALLDPKFRENVLKEGIKPKEGAAGFGSDAFEHTTSNTARENFISTTKELKQATDWGTKTNKKGASSGSAVAKITVKNGVDINLTARALAEEARFAGQLEVSIHGRIPSSLIRGILEVDAQGQVTWHNNPSFTPPNAAEAFQMVVEKKGMSPVIVTGFLPGIINYNSDEEEKEIK